MGAPANVHIDSTTALITAQGFSGLAGAGSPVPIKGPLAFAGDNDAVAKIDPSTGKITPVAVGVVNFSTKDMGDLDASGNPLEDTNQVTITLEPPVPPQSIVSTVTP